MFTARPHTKFLTLPWDPITLRVLQQAHAQVKQGNRLTDRLGDRYD